MAQSMKVEARLGDTNSREKSLSYPCYRCGCTGCRISDVVRRKGRARALWPRKAQKIIREISKIPLSIRSVILIYKQA